MFFWTSKKDEKNAQTPEVNQEKPDEALSELTNVLNDAFTSKSAYSTKEMEKMKNSDGTYTSLRDIASARAEKLGLELFPSEMSCLTAMDEVMECMSLGGQVRHYYRYGDFSMCDEQSEKVNFCFSNSLKSEVKSRNIQEFYKKQLVEKLKRGSSEDIWESRK
ncbi:unnamed protein product [Ambrosiozyma monospora]|uniref:Unnamed protein product n=1 Tax=Ambrosiozyma monospora TaxID=43982 RepID=A0ACB5T547_AMBMO|nr:unnamed protein product [Ambrosiozyma monospora]